MKAPGLWKSFCGLDTKQTSKHKVSSEKPVCFAPDPADVHRSSFMQWQLLHSITQLFRVIPKSSPFSLSGNLKSVFWAKSTLVPITPFPLLLHHWGERKSSAEKWTDFSAESITGTRPSNSCSYTLTTESQERWEGTWFLDFACRPWLDSTSNKL